MVTMATKRQGHSLNLLMNNMSCLVNQDTSSSWYTSQRDILLALWPSLASVSLLVHTGPEKNECLNMIITLCIYLNICIGCSKEPSPCYLEFKNQGIFNEKRAFFFKFSLLIYNFIKISPLLLKIREGGIFEKLGGGGGGITQSPLPRINWTYVG